MKKYGAEFERHLFEATGDAREAIATIDSPILGIMRAEVLHDSHSSRSSSSTSSPSSTASTPTSSTTP